MDPHSRTQSFVADAVSTREDMVVFRIGLDILKNDTGRANLQALSQASQLAVQASRGSANMLSAEDPGARARAYDSAVASVDKAYRLLDVVREANDVFVSQLEDQRGQIESLRSRIADLRLQRDRIGEADDDDDGSSSDSRPEPAVPPPPSCLGQEDSPGKTRPLHRVREVRADGLDGALRRGPS